MIWLLLAGAVTLGVLALPYVATQQRQPCFSCRSRFVSAAAFAPIWIRIVGRDGLDNSTKRHLRT
jgi:hypothetical protein